MTNEQKKYYEIGAITKACTLIEMLSTRKSWGLAEICAAVGMPKTTVHRMLLTLEDNGYVLQEKQRGEYSLSYKIFSISNRILSHTGIADIARPYCHRLLEATDETVNLCIVSGVEMIVIDKQVTSQTLRQDSIVGSSFPLFQSASGKVFLAFIDNEERSNIINLINAQEPLGNTKTAIQELYKEIEEIRRTGLAYDHEEVFKGVRCVATPIFNHQNLPVATLSISAPTVRLNESTCANIELHLLETGKKISQRLGASLTSFPDQPKRIA